MSASITTPACRSEIAPSASAAAAEAIGRRDGQLTRDETLAHIRQLAGATPLPLSADLGNGFGHRPEDCALTIRLAAEAGAVGGSIEDASSEGGAPILDFDLAVERVAAAVEAARALPVPFLVTARAENFLHGRADIDDTIRRLQAFDEAGADVLFAPGIVDEATLATICQAVGKPVSVIAPRDASIDRLAKAGIKRISLGPRLTQAMFGAVNRAAREILDRGTFTFMDEALPFGELQGLFFKP